MRRFLLLIVLSLAWSTTFAQRDLVPVDHPVYKFLLRQELRGTIHGFQWGMLPLSRTEVGSYLTTLAAAGTELPGSDQGELRDFAIEFGYDMNADTTKLSPFLPAFRFAEIAGDDRQKSLYAYTDSAASVFVDGLGWLSYRAGRGDSLGNHFASLGEIGFRVRGTLFNRLGFFMQATNGVIFSGSRDYAAATDRRLKTNSKFISGEATYFDFTNGYLRYDADWLAVMAGREQVLWGFGYQDRAVLGGNTAPFDYFKIDLKSNSVRYSFLHGSLAGLDTNGHNLSSKYIAAHRFEFNAGSRVRIGLNEAIIYANQPPLFAMMNPLVFLTSAELSTEIGGADDVHNSLIWIDAEVKPLRNVRLFGSLFIDDLKFSTISKTDISRNTNKFAWQLGGLWNDALTVPGLMLSLEYSRLNPFVMSHWTNVSSYTHWGMALGEMLPPNSDEWRMSAEYDVTNRLRASVQLQLQRTGENVIDPKTNRILYDAGSDVQHGENALVHPNFFLHGRRVNRTLATTVITWEPVRQWFLEGKCVVNAERYPVEDRSLSDMYVWGTIRVVY